MTEEQFILIIKELRNLVSQVQQLNRNVQDVSKAVAARR